MQALHTSQAITNASSKEYEVQLGYSLSGIIDYLLETQEIEDAQSIDFRKVVLHYACYGTQHFNLAQGAILIEDVSQLTSPYEGDADSYPSLDQLINEAIAAGPPTTDFQLYWKKLENSPLIIRDSSTSWYRLVGKINFTNEMKSYWNQIYKPLRWSDADGSDKPTLHHFTVMETDDTGIAITEEFLCEVEYQMKDEPKLRLK